MPAALPLIALAFHAASVIIPGTGFLVGIAQAATVATAAAAVNAVVANNTKPKERGGNIKMTVDPSAPRRLQIGKTMNSGVLVDWYLSDTKNRRIHMPIYLGEGPMGRVTRVFGGGRVVHDTPLVVGVRTEITEYRSGQGGDPGPRLWVTYYDGSPGQTADPALVALAQDWTEDNVMTGMAYIVLECQWDSDNMRAPASLSFENEGAKLYDRRKDTTAGGSGSHRANDPTTWEITDGDATEGANPMVAIDHIILGRYLDGRRVFGVGNPAAEVPYELFAHHANISDEDVDKKVSGTQKRYRASGIIFASEENDVIIRKLAQQMACTAADFGGSFGLVGMEARTPVMEIDDGDLVDGLGDFYSPKRPWSDLFSGVEGRFQDPANLYQSIDYPRITDAAWIAEDGSEARYKTHNLEFETDVERAQRLAWLKAKELRRQATLRGVYPSWAAELVRGDWFVRTGARWGEDGKIFEVIDRTIDTETGTVSIIGNEVYPEDSAWDEALARNPPTPTPGNDFMTRMDPPVIVATSTSIVGTSFAKPAIRVEWEVEADEADIDPRVKWLYIEIWPTEDEDQKVAATIAMPSDINFAVFDQGIVDGVEYTVRARFIGTSMQSAWSTTTTIVPTAPLTFGGLTATEIADSLSINAESILNQILLTTAWQAANEALLWIGGETVGEIALESRTTADGFAGDISLLGARNGGSTAFVLDLDTVEIPDDGAGAAISLRTLRSQHDGNTSQVNFLMEAAGGEAGVRLTTDVNGYINGLYIWNGGTPSTSGIAFLTGNFAIVDPGNGLTTPTTPFSVVAGVVKMGDVEVDTLKANIIVTDHIQVNQVTEDFVSTYTTDVTIPSNSTFVEVHPDVAFGNVGTRLDLDVTLQLKRNNGDRCSLEVKLMKDGSQVDIKYFADLFPFATNVPVDRQLRFTQQALTPGEYDWAVEVRIYDGNGGVSGWVCDASQIIFRDFKR